MHAASSCLASVLLATCFCRTARITCDTRAAADCCLLLMACACRSAPTSSIVSTFPPPRPVQVCKYCCINLIKGPLVVVNSIGLALGLRKLELCHGLFYFISDCIASIVKLGHIPSVIHVWYPQYSAELQQTSPNTLYFCKNFVLDTHFVEGTLQLSSLAAKR
jgi:hypothetical protein